MNNTVKNIATALILFILFIATATFPFFAKDYIVYFTIALPAIVCILFFSLRFLLRLDLDFNIYIYIGVVMVVAFVIRLIWINNFNSAVSSDFQYYYNYASLFAQGNFDISKSEFITFPYSIGFPMMMSMVFKLFGIGFKTYKVLNVVLSVFTLGISAITAKFIFGRKVAAVTAILFLIWPANIIYTSCFAPEHLYVFFLTLAIMLCFLSFNYIGKISGYALGFSSGSAMVFANYVNPGVLTLLLCIFIYLVVFIIDNKDYVKEIIMEKLIFYCSIALGAVCTFALLWVITFSLTGVDVSKQGLGFRLYVGTNAVYSGVKNLTDNQIINQHNGDYKKIEEETMSIAKERILTNIPGFLQLALINKPIALYGNEAYSFTLASDNMQNKNDFSKYLSQNTQFINFITQLFYVIILFYTFLGIRYYDKKEMIIVLFFIIFFISHIFLDVDSRYHFQLLPLFTIIAANGIINFYKKESDK